LKVVQIVEKQKSNSLNLLLFSVGGISFGIDADQVAEIAAYEGETSEDLFWFHEEVDYGGRTVGYCSPTVVTIRSGNDFTYRVIIDCMEDIAEFSHSDIALFPALLEPFSLKKGMWGILSRQGKMTLLLDFERLLKEKAPPCNK
jgi:chemotaxis signal transduction protein